MKGLSDTQVEKEIEKLNNSEYVKLARMQERIKYKRRQKLYCLRQLEKKGKELAKSGITIETLKNMERESEL